MQRAKVCHTCRIGRPANFRLGTQMEHEEPHHGQAPWPPKSKVVVTRSRGPSDRCWPVSQEENVPETPKSVGELPMPRTIMRTSFKVKMSKVKVTRPINAVTDSAPYAGRGHYNFLKISLLWYVLLNIASICMIICLSLSLLIVFKCAIVTLINNTYLLTYRQNPIDLISVINRT